jgi:hypothetical protein
LLIDIALVYHSLQGAPFEVSKRRWVVPLLYASTVPLALQLAFTGERRHIWQTGCVKTVQLAGLGLIGCIRASLVVLSRVLLKTVTTTLRTLQCLARMLSPIWSQIVGQSQSRMEVRCSAWVGVVIHATAQLLWNTRLAVLQ